MEVVAIRDISPGEEITHSCKSSLVLPCPRVPTSLTPADAPLGLNHKDRQEVVSEWGFTCKCPLCSSSSKTIQKSDRRRDRIREIKDILTERDDLSRDQVDRFVDELLRLVDEEKLEVQLVVFYEVIARAYMEVFDFEKAREYATMAEEAWIQYGGVGHDNVEGVKFLWLDLKEML